MRFRPFVLAFMIVSSSLPSNARAQEGDCVPNWDDVAKAASEYTFEGDPGDFVKDKWLQLEDQRVDFGDDGTSYHMLLSYSNAPKDLRWKGKYEVKTDETGSRMLCFRTSLDQTYVNECGYLFSQPTTAASFAVLLAFETCYRDSSAHRIARGVVMQRGKGLLGRDFPGGESLVQQGRFLD